MRLLVVSPHPDDETLGAGGVLLKYKKSGHKTFWLNFTDKRKEHGYSFVESRARAEEIRKVGSAYGFTRMYNLGLQPAGLESYPRKELIEKARCVIEEVLPQVIILPFNEDAHTDHRVVFDTVYPCTKAFRNSAIKKILLMETISETDFALSHKGFVPNYFVDISDFLEKKIKIMGIYRGELKPHPFPRSPENLRALALHRGATAGCKYAESFILLKEVC